MPSRARSPGGSRSRSPGLHGGTCLGCPAPQDRPCQHPGRHCCPRCPPCQPWGRGWSPRVPGQAVSCRAVAPELRDPFVLQSRETKGWMAVTPRCGAAPQVRGLWGWEGGWRQTPPALQTPHPAQGVPGPTGRYLGQTASPKAAPWGPQTPGGEQHQPLGITVGCRSPGAPCPLHHLSAVPEQQSCFGDLE